MFVTFSPDSTHPAGEAGKGGGAGRKGDVLVNSSPVKTQEHPILLCKIIFPKDVYSLDKFFVPKEKYKHRLGSAFTLFLPACHFT